MSTAFKKLPGSIIELEVVLTQSEFKEYWEDVYNNAFSKVHLKGFRPGAAPKELTDAAIDKERVFSEAANDAVRYSLDEIIKKNGWVLIDKPQVEVDEHKMGLKYIAKLTIFPEINFGNYKEIVKKIFSEAKEIVKSIKIEPEEVDKALGWLRNSRNSRRTEFNKNNEVEVPIGTSEKDGNIPEMNDEFAKSLGKFSGVDDLKKSITEGLKIEKEMRERDKARIKVLDEIIKDSKIDVPEIMIEKTLSQMAGENKEIQEKLRDKAKQNVLANLVLYKIAEEEKIPYDPERGVDNIKVFEYLEGLATK